MARFVRRYAADEIAGNRVFGKALLCFGRALTFGARRALLLPLRVGPLQQILRAGAAKMRATILHHHFTIDVAGAVRDQEAREVGKFRVFAGAAERIARRPALVAAFGAQLA